MLDLTLKNFLKGKQGKWPLIEMILVTSSQNIFQNFQEFMNFEVAK